MSADLEANIEAAHRAIARKIQSLPHLVKLPEWAIILGSGLEAAIAPFDTLGQISYAEIDGFPDPPSGQKIKGHAGVLKFCAHPKRSRGGSTSNTIVVMQGRFHYYEGHELHEVALPVRVLHRLGVKNLIITNAAGGINPKLKPGGLMLIDDHLNLIGANPLRGRNLESYGPRFPDMSQVYDRTYLNKAKALAKKLQMPLKSGVYAAVSGPSYETPAEVRMLDKLGADAVGMSTVPEAIVAQHQRMRLLGISMIANLAAGLSATPLNHDEVVATGKLAAEQLGKFLWHFLKEEV